MRPPRRASRAERSAAVDRCTVGGAPSVAAKLGVDARALPAGRGSSRTPPPPACPSSPPAPRAGRATCRCRSGAARGTGAARAERLRAEVALEHREQRPALGVGDGVERVVDVVIALDGLAHLPRALLRVRVDGTLERRRRARARRRTPGAPPPRRALPIQVAKASFSQMSSHHGIVTRLPNHWCASSCALTETERAPLPFGRLVVQEQQRVAEGDGAGVLHRARRRSRAPR